MRDYANKVFGTKCENPVGALVCAAPAAFHNTIDIRVIIRDRAMFGTEEPRPGTGAGDRLAALAAAWQIACDDAQTTSLLAYADLLLRWSARINLTAARSVDVLIADHFPDAFALARQLDQPARVIDVGSGGGLPALPLALIRPELSILLCEPIAKKGAFLRTAIRELDLAARVELAATRGEQLANEYPGAFDAAISRATLPPEKWLPLGLRLVRPGGRVFVLTTPPTLPQQLRRQVYLDGKRVLIEVQAPDRST
jgi:16S rRNA (guanine527-N7)-methyltransferase